MSETQELRRRAQRLATPPPAPDAIDQLDTLGFSWAGAHYRLQATHVRETVRTGDVAAVPGAQLLLLGVVTVRAEAVPLIDLRPLLSLPAPSRTVSAVVVLEHGGRASLAVAADELHRLVTLDPSRLSPADDGSGIAHAVTPDGATLLDADALLDLPPFFPTQ